ncbi:terminase [Levilactobacillus yiduensis]|uniref:terminase n=1 Tax=Levilactobacillus yiduensis TaxID=2953880 RepID=UPI00215752E3|nr:terminase [Levilactobacillus yiduensis]
MTALNALIDTDTIVLSMDTLVSMKDSEGKTVPQYFTQKFEYLPFAQSVIAGTGVLDVLKKSFNASREILAFEVDVLADNISKFLKEDEWVSSLPKELTSTIYVLGFTKDGETKAFALRSTNNFDAQVIAAEGQATAIFKPDLSSTDGFFDELEAANRTEDVDERLVKLMRVEKKYDDLDPYGVGIGGENIRLVFNSDASDARISKIDVFDDYVSQYQEAYNNL